MRFSRWQISLFDLEGDGLMDSITRLHCATLIDVVTGEQKGYPPEALPDFLEDMRRVQMYVGHNIIDFDLPAMELLYDFRWEVPSTVDTLVFSRLLNPDLLGGHSLEAWGDRLGERKIDWRGEAESLGLVKSTDPRGSEFRVYHPQMLTYCKQDGIVNLKLLRRLMKQVGWKYEDLLDIYK